jgi:hypothetical protein
MRDHTLATLAEYLRSRGAIVRLQADSPGLGSSLLARHGGRRIRAVFHPLSVLPTRQGHGSGLFSHGIAFDHPNAVDGDKVFQSGEMSELIAWLCLPVEDTAGDTYIARASRIVAEETGVTDPALLPLYTLLALTMGEATTPAHVHEAWALWKQPLRPDHWSLIPFDELDPAEAAKDQRYVDAIRRAAVRLAAGEHLS